MADKLLKPEELAARWRVSTRALIDWRWRGKGLPFLKIGGRIFIERKMCGITSAPACFVTRAVREDR